MARDLRSPGSCPSGQAASHLAGKAAAIPRAPARDERLFWFLTILDGMRGVSDASESAYSWVNTFVEDRGNDDDTFNVAADLGYTNVGHDSDFDSSTVYLTDKGRAFLYAQPENADRTWLIRKKGWYYGPYRAGYFSTVASAGRYTQAEAEQEAKVEPWHMAAVRLADAVAAESAKDGSGEAGETETGSTRQGNSLIGESRGAHE